MVQPTTRRLAQSLNPHRERDTVRIPHPDTGRLGEKHPDPVAAKLSFARNPCRSARAASLFVRNKHKSDPSPKPHAAFLQRANGKEHGHNSAFHIAGTAAK